ncbi:Slp family lipoprotein [Erwinia psidii]|uniref:Slp family lipoprotein n=1 Tax=Erwinia psidii TaxID=69224 RepID=A0A3N6S0V4_9GAMM|nr:Slp family lipoprotein [Erwinia psidii]MCX8956175.1 Slp family lipoprotein [Erwinia psidii]MCX8960065.1 Slp family lipoprotein [Erwinia psidii]MCX8963611.1 Slp family lipoprotein [Erwinia psidii]RQM39178.1 Slp family lipoprotein [Erwinia psidii]
MRKRVLLQSGSVVLLLSLLTGCVSVPDSVRGTSPTPQQDLVRVMNAPQLYVGQESRFGGKVVKVINKDGVTRLEIAAMPLDDTARPILGSPSIGRVYADIKGFVDPVDFNNQMVTVVGPVTGSEKGQVGQASYHFVKVNVTGYQRWHLTQQVITPPQPVDPWIWYGPPRGRHRGGYWGPPPGGFYNQGPVQVQTILTE